MSATSNGNQHHPCNGQSALDSDSSDGDVSRSGYDLLDTADHPDDQVNTDSGQGREADPSDDTATLAHLIPPAPPEWAAARLASLAEEARWQSTEANSNGVSLSPDGAPSMEPRPVDVATLTATARALHERCQPVDFAGWGTGTSRGTANTAGTQPAIRRPEDLPAGAASSSSRQTGPVPKVVMAREAGGAVDLDLDEEKRRAILGAMKNINLEYTPDWAALVPEQAWMRVLMPRQPPAAATMQEPSGRRQH